MTAETRPTLRVGRPTEEFRIRVSAADESFACPRPSADPRPRSMPSSAAGSCCRRISSITDCRSAGSGDSNAIRRPSVGCVKARRARVEERALQPLHRPDIVGHVPVDAAVGRSRRRSGGRSRSGGRESGACGPWRSRRAAATRPSSAPPCVTRVTALRARRARVDIFCRSPGSRPIGSSMRRPAWTDAPDQREVFLLDLAVVELARELPVRRVVLRGHHHARGAAIEPVHDARGGALRRRRSGRPHGGAAR